jgi:hypothetical protein
MVRYQARVLTNTVDPRPSPLKASFWNVKQVDPAWDDLGLRARIGILPSPQVRAPCIGVGSKLSDSGGCTDRHHLNSGQVLRIELNCLLVCPNQIPGFEPSIHQKARYVNVY